MKLLKRLKRKKGFTLTEVMVAMLIFALMSSIVMQILAIAIMRHKKNDSIDKDMDAQISNLVQENALVERDTVDLVMKFVSPTGGTNNIKINDVKINKDDTPADSDSLYWKRLTLKGTVASRTTAAIRTKTKTAAVWLPMIFISMVQRV